MVDLHSLDLADGTNPTVLPCQELETIWVPILDEKCPSGYRLQEQLMLFPHRIITFLFDECNFNINMEHVGMFWDMAVSTGQPFANAGSRHRIPIGLYGDSAQLVTSYKVEKQTCLFINLPLFRPRAVRFSRFLVWSCDSHLLYRNRTMNCVLRWLTWSFNCMFEGTNPKIRPGNRPLSESEIGRAGHPLTKQGYQFQLTECRGDWEWHKLLWNFHCSWKGGVNMGICFKCPCMAKTTDPGLLYFNEDENPTWNLQEFDTFDFITKRLPTRHICFLASQFFRRIFFTLPFEQFFLQRTGPIYIYMHACTHGFATKRIGTGCIQNSNDAIIIINTGLNTPFITRGYNDPQKPWVLVFDFIP